MSFSFKILFNITTFSLSRFYGDAFKAFGRDAHLSIFRKKNVVDLRYPRSKIWFGQDVCTESSTTLCSHFLVPFTLPRYALREIDVNVQQQKDKKIYTIPFWDGLKLWFGLGKTNVSPLCRRNACTCC